MSVTAEPTAIRPFRNEVPEEQLAELRRRLAATRWPSSELLRRAYEDGDLVKKRAKRQPIA